MFNADADRLQIIREECAVLYIEEQESLGEVNVQDPWMEMIAMRTEISDA